MKAKADTAFQTALRAMPVLHHTIPGQPFSLDNSEVVKWLISQPVVLQWIFDKARYSGRIVYDEASGTWRGATDEDVDRIRGQWREAKKPSDQTELD